MCLTAAPRVVYYSRSPQDGLCAASLPESRVGLWRVPNGDNVPLSGLSGERRMTACMTEKNTSNTGSRLPRNAPSGSRRESDFCLPRWSQAPLGTLASSESTLSPLTPAASAGQPGSYPAVRTGRSESTMHARRSRAGEGTERRRSRY